MYKLPMFGCTDPSQVLTEINNATRAFPDAYIRICGSVIWLADIFCRVLDIPQP